MIEIDKSGMRMKNLTVKDDDANYAINKIRQASDGRSVVQQWQDDCSQTVGSGEEKTKCQSAY